MDQISIGRFIAAERKRKGCTQKQLAEKLNISDKTVSKWECGKGFPEVSLLSGARVSEEEYQKKAEENMVNMIKEREENKKKLIPTIITGLIATISFITLIMVVAVYTEVIAVPVKILLIVIACVIFGCGLMVAMEGERTIGYYKCRHCNELFVPTFGAYTMGMHMISTRYLKCPKCGTKTWCKKVLAKEK